MIITEINFQEDFPANYQLRFIKVPSWETYKELLVNNHKTTPRITAPEGFKITSEVPDTYLRGEWYWNGSIFIHEAHICPAVPVVENVAIEDDLIR